eukprot:scaffold1231_cov187-Pinguiococcus_pyrenoidosus.AAC.1
MSERTPPVWPEETGEEPRWWEGVQKVYESSGKALYLSDNYIGAEGAKALAERGLPSVPQLTQLDLDENAIGDEGAKALAERGLPSVPQLTQLVLFLNSIGDEGAKALAERGLPSVPQLTQLDLGGNSIGDEGAKALAERGLPSVPQLTQLYLSYNSIGAEGAKALAERGLPSVPQLTQLYLGDNSIGAKGAKALAERGLPSVPQLTQLYLWDNSIGAEGAKALAERGLPSVPQLTQLSLWGNAIGDEGVKAIGRALLKGACPSLSSFLADSSLSSSASLLALEMPIEWEGKKSNSFILAFHRLRCQGQSRRFAAAKVLIAGPAAAGKTCLANAIVENTNSWRQHFYRRDQTDGMEVVRWERPTQDLDAVLLYDFGGQPVYKASHRLFMGGRAVFVVVWNPRAENDGDRKDYEEYARDVLDEQPSARIAFVSTHRDVPDLRYPGVQQMGELLHQRFDDNFDSYDDVALTPPVVGAPDALGGLRQLVLSKVMALPNIRLTMPQSFRALLERLQQISWTGEKWWISHREFLQVAEACECHVLKQDHGNGYDMPGAALELFDQWGYVKVVKSAGRNDVVLDPSRLAEALALVISDDPKKRERCPGGFLRNQALLEAWEQYPEALLPGFMNLIEEYGLGFPVRDDAGTDYDGMLILPMLQGAKEKVEAVYRRARKRQRAKRQLLIQ